MALDTADRLRAAGLAVIECAGWQGRGSSDFNPRGSVDHHTAGPPTGNAPSLNVCISGRPDLPGPLCQVLIGRDNTCYVIAAGRANHAGSGGWNGLAGNSSVFGIERENVGTPAEPWRESQTDTAARAHAALIRGRAQAAAVCRHQEWAPGRKIDTHTLTGDELRRRTADHLAGIHQPTRSRPVFCLVQPDDGRGVYRFDGAAMVGVPNPTALGGDQIVLATLGLPNQVMAVSADWFNTWPVARP